MNRELWDHQKEAIESLRQTVRQGVRKIVLAAPTGSGKTALSAAIVENALSKGNRTTFVVPAIDLVDQTVEAFWSEGIRDIGVIQADHEMTDWSKPVQVCSIQTVQSRKEFPKARINIFDECHRLFKAHKEWLAHPDFTDCTFIGLSATPWTKGLGKYFDTMIIAATTQELIDKGFLSPFRVFATGHPDLTGVSVVAGEYHEGQLSEAMQKGTLVADIVDTYKKRWGKGKTLCFGVDCAHAQTLQQRFNEAGIPCGYQDAFTPKSERKEIRRKFHSGEYEVVANVGTLTTGVDWDVRCLVLARPTRSEMLYVQIIGRALRVADGKEHALILDHSDTTQRLGLVTDIHHEALDDGKPKKATVAEKKAPLPTECEACGYLKPPRVAICPNCGAKCKVSSELMEQDGELVEVTGSAGIKSNKAAKRVWSMQEKAAFLSELKTYGRNHGYKTGWASRKYQEKFGVWPDWSIKDVAPAVAISTATSLWIRAQQIAWAKSRNNPANRDAPVSPPMDLLAPLDFE